MNDYISSIISNLDSLFEKDEIIKFPLTTSYYEILLTNNKIIKDYKNFIKLLMVINVFKNSFNILKIPDLIKKKFLSKNKTEQHLFLGGGINKTKKLLYKKLLHKKIIHNNEKNTNIAKIKQNNNYKYHHGGSNISNKIKKSVKYVKQNLLLHGNNKFTDFTNISNNIKNLDEINANSINTTKISSLNNFLLYISNIIVDYGEIVGEIIAFITDIAGLSHISMGFKFSINILKYCNQMFRLSLTNFDLLINIDITNIDHFKKIGTLLENNIFIDYDQNTKDILSINLSTEINIDLFINKYISSPIKENDLVIVKQNINTIYKESIKYLFIDILKYRFNIANNLDNIFKDNIFAYFIEDCFLKTQTTEQIKTQIYLNQQQNISNISPKVLPPYQTQLNAVITEIFTILNFNQQNIEQVSTNNILKNTHKKKTILLLLLKLMKKLFYIHTPIKTQKIILEFINKCLFDDNQKKQKLNIKSTINIEDALEFTYCFNLLDKFIKLKIKQILKIQIPKYNILENFKRYVLHFKNKIIDEENEKNLYKTEFKKIEEQFNDSIIEKCNGEELSYIFTKDDNSYLKSYLQIITHDKKKSFHIDKINEILELPLIDIMINNLDKNFSINYDTNTKLVDFSGETNPFTV